MRDLKITLIQSELSWEDIAANLSMFTQKIETVDPSTDLIVLPEMFTTGFSMQAEKLAQQIRDRLHCQWRHRMAQLLSGFAGPHNNTRPRLSVA